MVDNYDWFHGVGYLDFLRDVGKHFSVNMMLAKESVRARLEDREHGISYTEFSYMLIQAYDFLSLYDRHGCTLQIGGSDQWGNITAGIDLVRRLRAKEVYGLTMPLVTNSSGQKFGKSEKGNIWLDAGKTSPYDFYQFFFRVDDRDVGRFLRYFTFLDEPTILALEEQVQVGAGEARGAADVGARGDQARARRGGGGAGGVGAAVDGDGAAEAARRRARRVRAVQVEVGRAAADRAGRRLRRRRAHR